ncbi:TetR/AcrR family transcriptional regulator [Paenibacillus endoradicis]|uniref:TetR/AcrR family transcriptional regulator n=1 Tax=Paenibacillus endoradicis TaxID=2972487 RepID=UPI002158D16E|nr:TetR/AcrR family transcriptional regulator [Paenibacillus endoradicis]MCR8660672.1 TetR/AcrR family transcriptional regulator [Paenibacillus endoradicis]
MVARNREQLIHIAARLFLSKGYKYTSIEDVCTRSGISRSNLYYHFKSKEELLFAVVSFWGNRYESALEISLGQQEISAKRRIESFIDLLLQEIEARGNKGTCPFIAMYQQSPVDAKDVHDRIQQFFKMLHELINKLLEQGITNGEFRAGISASECAYLFVSALEGSLILAETMNDISIVRTTSDRFFKLLV